MLDLKDVNIKGATLTIFGTFVATVDVEVSHDGGTTFLIARDEQGNAISGFTAATLREIAGDATQIRGNATAYTSGTVQFGLMVLHD